MGQWHSAKVFAFVTPCMHPLSGQRSEHSSSSHHCSCCLCRDPGLDASAPCRCLDAAAVSQGQWYLVQAKVAPPSPLTAAKGPLKQPQDQGRANPLEQQLCHYPWPRHTEENLARVWWSFPGCVLCEDPEPLIFMLKSLQGKNLEGAEFSCAFKIHAFKTPTFISWTAEISCCEIIFCENTNPPHTSHWKYFFPVSRISISFEVCLLLINREGVFFLFKFVLVQGPFFVTVHLLAHVAVGGRSRGSQELQSHSCQSRSHMWPRSPCAGPPPTVPTGEWCRGHCGMYSRELAPLWGRQPLLVGVTDQALAVCRTGTGSHHSLSAPQGAAQGALFCSLN